MITEQLDIEEGHEIHADICIIGGGPAAISIALELQSLQKKIVILTGGKREETSFNQDLNKGLVAEGTSHEPLEANRRRQFGGGSAAWGGRCLPFEPIDFTRREWIPNSGWPFDYEHILPYYNRAAKLVKVGEFDFHTHDKREIIPGMDNEDITSTAIERWSPPVNFAAEYSTEMNSSKYIDVYVNAHALKLHTQNAPETISHIDAYMNGKKFKVTAGNFILAAGGLENPRLLLSSANTAHPNGIGSKNDNVGRYYMAHLGGIYAELCFNGTDNIITKYERDPDGVYFRRRWWLTDGAQKKYNLRNIIFYLDNHNGENGEIAPLFSSVVVAKSLLSVVRQKSFSKAKNKMKEISPKLKKHSFNFLLRGWKQIPDIVSKSIMRLPKRRLPSILPPASSKYWGVYFQAEQSPLRESRVTVTNEEKDSLGMPRLKVNIKINPDDVESVIKAHNIFISQFQKSGAGTFFYTEGGLRNCLEDLIRNSFNSGAHHLGTTRISVTDSTGVVDFNSKVYGINNLFIAGASVFPTGGHANPTLTIIALSLRLADYLKKNIIN